MKIAVTGATGFLGRHLCPLLKSLGHEVSEYNSGNLDITKPVEFLGSLDVVYHLAANSRVYFAKKEPVADFTVNSLGTLHILEAAKKSGAKKVIYTSTDLVYKNLVNLGEDMEVGPNPTSGPYGLSKLIGEYYIQMYQQLYGISYVILRPSSYYGPGMKKNAVYDFIQAFLRKEEVTLFHDLDSEFDFIYIEDVAHALVMSLEWEDKVINVSTGHSVTLKELYEVIKELMQYEVPLAYSGELVRVRVDNTKLKALGWQSRYSLKEGVARTIESFKESTLKTARTSTKEDM